MDARRYTHRRSAWGYPCESGARRLRTAPRAPAQHSPARPRPQDRAKRRARGSAATRGTGGAERGSRNRPGSPQSRSGPAAPRRGRWRSRQRRRWRAPFFRWCRWSASYQYRRAPAPSICSAGQVQCGRARICRTTARGTAAKMSATYRSDTGPEDWTRSCVPCPCRGGQRPSGPCLRF